MKTEIIFSDKDRSICSPEKAKYAGIVSATA